jgi:hypothetical protein
MKTSCTQQLNDRLKSKVRSIQRRTADDTADELRFKLSLAELQLENALDKLNHLMRTDWTSLMVDSEAELLEAARLSHRRDSLRSRRAKEILNNLLERLRQGRQAVDNSMEGNHESSFPKATLI